MSGFIADKFNKKCSIDIIETETPALQPGLRA